MNPCLSRKDAMRPTRHKTMTTRRQKTCCPAKNQGSLGGPHPSRNERGSARRLTFREIKREKVIDHAEKLLDSTQEFNPELEYYCSSLMPLIEKLEFENHQCCMIAIRQTIFTFMFLRHETAVQPMSVQRYMAGGGCCKPPSTSTSCCTTANAHTPTCPQASSARPHQSPPPVCPCPC